MASHSRHDFGAWGEEVAARYLIDKGYEIIQRNARTSEGELDIVARDGECLVFVEVKARGNRTYGSPEEALTIVKQRRLIRAAWSFLQELGMSDSPWRIDVIAIEGSIAEGVQRLDHYEYAVGIEGDL
jgi:putative endonuclease